MGRPPEIEPLSKLGMRKRRIFENSERYAPERGIWLTKAAFFYSEDISYLRFLIPPGRRILELGCGVGDVLTALQPSVGVGLDFSPGMIEQARRAHPHLHFHVADIEDRYAVEALEGPFDFILIVDTLGSSEDCQALLESLHSLCNRDTRLVVAYFSHLWQPVLKLAELLRLRMPQPPQNVLSPADLRALAALGGFEAIKSERRMLIPFRLLGIGRLVNRFLSHLPLLRQLALRHYLIARSIHHAKENLQSATVVIPARNERGNIEPTIRRLPRFAERLEIIFVEGHSSDGTLEEMHRVSSAYSDRDIKVIVQPGIGKADAVYAAFDIATSDVLMILDSDLTVLPEQLPKFWTAICEGKGEFIYGSRFIYPMEDDSMPFLNLIANKVFSYLFSWLLDQRCTDTLCGTKAVKRADYLLIKAGRTYFGDFDPFGDFDLIFGASKLNLKFLEIPVRYVGRTYGTSQISRLHHGFALAKMAIFAFFKIKAL
jgi:SAM-dependent methyltransferase